MSRELYPGYIVKAKGQKGKITAVNLHTVVVQLGDHKENFKREDIEVLEATKDSDVKTYTANQFKMCAVCGKPKLLEEFGKLRGKKHRNQCRECWGKLISDGHKKAKYEAKPFKPNRDVKREEPVKEIKTVEEWVERNLKEPVKHNAVVKPSHYVGTNGLEVKQVLEEFVKDKAGITAHRWCSAVEYLLRAYEKNGREDLEKAKMNIEWLIEGAE
ncbi:DUF3310 domain-containing protein [Globicatella sanguinis]